MQLFKVDYDIKSLGVIQESDSVYVYTDTQDKAISGAEALIGQLMTFVPEVEAARMAVSLVTQMPEGSILAGVAMAAIPSDKESPMVTLVGDGGGEVN